MAIKRACPDVAIEPADTPARPVRLECCPVTLNPLLPDRQLIMHQYNAASGSLDRSLTARSYGPILFENSELVEVHRTLTLRTGAVMQETQWGGICGDTIRIRLRDRAAGERQDSRRVDLIDMSFPAVMTPGLNHVRTVRYHHGTIRADENYVDREDGAVILTAGPFSGKCIRLVTRPEPATGRVIETYIDERAGLPVYAVISLDGSPCFIQFISVESVTV